MSEPDRSTATTVKTCFVMMPFAQNFDRYYRNIFVPAIKKSGLDPVRGDGIFGSAIVADIWRILKRSSIALADLTGRNPNVFYELGLAHALGKAVILVASNSGDVPIDLGGLRVILYNKDEEDWGVRLQADIERSIAEILEDPIRGVPATFSDPDVQSCLIGDPLQLEIRRLAEEVKGLRFLLKQTATDHAGSNKSGDYVDAVLAEIFPRTRQLGLSWGQARHVIELVLAGRETEALSYITDMGVARADADSTLSFISDRCKA
jgi:hypothetical protein